MIAANVYLLAERAVRRLLPRAHAAWAGVWLGVLPRRGLHAVDQAMYDQRSNYREAAHNRRGLFAWEQTAVDGYFAGRSRVAVLGAGAGRELLALWRMGFAPTGFECNPSLVDAAVRLLPAEGCPHRVILVPRDQAPPPGGVYDAAIIGWSAYSLIAGSAARIAMLRGMRALLPARGPILLSFFTRADDDTRAARVLAVSNRIRYLLRREPTDHGDDLLPNFVHRFTRAEVEQELREAGFQLQRFEPQGPGRYDSGWAVGEAT